MEKNKFRMKFLQKGEEGAERPALHIYGDIYETYKNWMNEEDGNTAKGMQQFLDANKDAEAIDVYINSMGGDVFEGTAMANQLIRFPGKVIVTVDGFACSVASVIAMAGDEVRMPKNATMMLHNMWTWMSGNAAELRKMADDLDVLMEANKTVYLEKAGDKLDYDKLTELLDAETWLTAEQCVEYGLADVVLERTIDRDAAIEAAGIGETSQRADDAIKALQRSRDLINDLVEFVEVEELELEEEEEDEKPHNFLDMFS